MSITKPAPKAPAGNPMKRYYIFFGVLAVVAALTIVSNVALRRAPVHDARAAQDIRNLQAAVDNYYLRQNQLPAALDEVAIYNGDTKKRLADYEYRRLGNRTYALCTTFMAASSNAKPTYAPDMNVPDPEIHGKGRDCFSYTVLPINAHDLPLGR